jgi:TMEM175 potassium channel family protein
MDTNRLEAFSDGVFAIAITLLVLDIKLPQSGFALGRELLDLWPSYFAYAISFIVIGAIWINHHSMFDHIVRADRQLLLLNTLHLMFIAFLPFPTAVLAQAIHNGADEPLAVSFYGGTLTVIGVLVSAMWYYAAHEHRLLGESLSRDEARRNGRMFLVGPVGYAIATLIALIVPWLALTIYVALNVFFLWPRRWHIVNTSKI